MGSAASVTHPGFVTQPPYDQAPPAGLAPVVRVLQCWDGQYIIIFDHLWFLEIQLFGD